MRKKSIVALAGMLVMVFTLYGCWGGKTVTRNIRVIAKAEVGGKMVEGSAVMGLRWQAGSNGRMYKKSNVDAVILKLDGRGTVYVTHSYLTDDGESNRGYWPIQVLRSFGIRGNGQKSDFPKLRSLKGRHPVKPLVGSPKTLPVMVSFSDEAKRETMIEVKPVDFPRVFGSDVRFVGLWFEFTDDPETGLMAGRLPVMLKANESYRKKFPIKDRNGNLIPSREWALPQKIGKYSFFERNF